MEIEGTVWIFGDEVNTDLMLPLEALSEPEEERVTYLFQSHRPGWAERVETGDVIVAGDNFGVGSSRPAPAVMHRAGIRGVVAESMNGLFFRNCINSGLPAMDCPGCTDWIHEGDRVRLETREGTVTVLQGEHSGKRLEAQSLPAGLEDIVESGGVYALLAERGLLESADEMPLS